MDLDLAMLTFGSIDGAERAFGQVRDRMPDAAWLHELGLAERHRNGRIRIRGTFVGHYLDVDDEGDVIGRDTAIGALTGVVLGAALGPPGWAAGLVTGGAVGGLVQATHVPEPHGELFDEIRSHLPRGSSAVVLLAAPEHAEAMIEAFAGTGGEVMRRHLPDEAVTAIETGLAAAPPAAH